MNRVDLKGSICYVLSFRAGHYVHEMLLSLYNRGIKYNCFHSLTFVNPEGGSQHIQRDLENDKE